MTLFDQAFQYTVMKWEGGATCTHDPDDPGGVTKYGISKRAHPNVDVENLTEEQAKGIYQSDYWNRLGCDNIGGVVALKLFDAGVNLGVNRAAILAQQAYNDTLSGDGISLTPDGVVGYRTIEALHQVNPEAWLDAFESRLLNHYNYLVGKNPALGKFLKGWTRRAESVPEPA
jgi:lysozyme family protein